MSNPTCGQCSHWREQPRPTDARTGAVAIDPDAPRMGNCFKGPPHVVMHPTPQGMALGTIYPPLKADHDPCDQFTPRVPLNGTADPAAMTAWWDDTLRRTIAAGARGETFLADCLMDDLDLRLRQADRTERRVLLHSLMGLYQALDRLHEAGRLLDRPDEAEGPPS